MRTALLACLLALSCGSPGPLAVAKPGFSEAVREAVRRLAMCTDREWTADQVRAAAFAAFSEHGVAETNYAGRRGVMPLIPEGWPNRSCSVALYAYYVEEPFGVERFGRPWNPDRGSSPLLASAHVDLKTGAVEVRTFDAVDEESGRARFNWVYFRKPWRVAETYAAVQDAENELLNAVMTGNQVSGDWVFDAYGGVWKLYPHYIDYVPAEHRPFVQDVLRVYPITRPRRGAGWSPVFKPGDESSLHHGDGYWD
jgi:hypothetical protein